jgi:Spy/CpxP family protein refolding chaperone
MRRIKISIAVVLALGVLTAFGPNAYAQTGEPALANMHGGLQQMLKKLNLTPSQDQEIKQILIGEMRQLKAAGGNAEQEKAIKSQGRDQVASVLTREQKQKLKKMMLQKAAANKGNAELQEEANHW